MALEGQHGVVAHHAAAVVGDLDQLFPARFDVHSNALRPGVQRILQQLLDY